MRTSQEIIDETNEIARIIYLSRGYEVSKGFEFHTETKNRHPHEEQCWLAACMIQLLMTQTDPRDAIDELDEEEC